MIATGHVKYTNCDDISFIMILWSAPVTLGLQANL